MFIYTYIFAHTYSSHHIYLYIHISATVHACLQVSYIYVYLLTETTFVDNSFPQFLMAPLRKLKIALGLHWVNVSCPMGTVVSDRYYSLTGLVVLGSWKWHRCRDPKLTFACLKGSGELQLQEIMSTATCLVWMKAGRTETLCLDSSRACLGQGEVGFRWTHHEDFACFDRST